MGNVPERLSEGQVLASRYVIEALLGDGAMGAVYRARHIKVGRKFAVKVLHRTLTSNVKMLQRFEREAELAGRLHHPNLIGVVDVGVTDNGLHYLVMEFAPGESLANLIAQAPMEDVRVIDLAQQLCDGLQAAHDAGLVHRDFKPENVIVELDPSGREIPRIVDFGVAILRDDSSGGDDRGRLTTKGIVIGTPHYMAPEQALGCALDHRVDLFALGLICYELLTGKLPFEGDGVEIARANVTSATPPMGVRVPTVTVDPVLEAIVGTLLEKDPADRPPSAAATRELLDLYLRDRTAAAEQVGLMLPVVVEPPPPVVEPPPVEVPPPDAPSSRARREQERTTEDVLPDRRRGRRLAAILVLVAIAIAAAVWLGARTQTKTTVVEAAPEIVVPGTPLEDVSVHDHGGRADVVPPAPVVKPIVPAPAPAPDPAMKHPAPAPAAAPSLDTISAADVASLYGAVGRELKALETAKGGEATYDLWPRYRWIRINEWLGTQTRRTSVATSLDKLRRDVAAARKK